jgi:hypothetical protein
MGRSRGMNRTGQDRHLNNVGMLNLWKETKAKHFGVNGWRP